PDFAVESCSTPSRVSASRALSMRALSSCSRVATLEDSLAVAELANSPTAPSAASSTRDKRNGFFIVAPSQRNYGNPRLESSGPRGGKVIRANPTNRVRKPLRHHPEAAVASRLYRSSFPFAPITVRSTPPQPLRALGV